MSSQANLEHLWMPFSANRGFKAEPRLMNEAKRDVFLNRMVHRYWMVQQGYGVVMRVMEMIK